ncbi:MAG: universal stress protein [Ginsengibacter sp.]|jgi:nucleotide-binding universal stress UspA family protein
MKKILIAVDYDPSAQKIAETGYSFAKAMGGQVTLLHVTSDATYYSSLNYSPIMGFDSFSNLDVVQTDVVDQLRQGAEDYLAKTREFLGDSTIQTIVKDGDFGDSILEVADEINADIIVMGTHSRSGWDKLLMGSVAEKVLQRSKIPLFIIPSQKEEEK